MRELNMAVLPTLGISANNHALSTSVSNKLAEVAMDRDTTAHDEGKRSLRVKETTGEILDEDRMEGPSEPVLRDFLAQIGKNHEELQRLLERKKLETLQRPVYLSAEQEAQVEWLRYFLKKALEDAEFSPDDAKVSEVVGAQPQSMVDLIKLWGLESNNMVQAREGLLEKELGDFAKDRVRNMAIGSVRLQQHVIYVHWSKVSTSSDDELLALLNKDDELLKKLELDPDQVRIYALLLLEHEKYLPEIPVIIDMAIGGAYFKVFKERKAFKKMKIST